MEGEWIEAPGYAFFDELYRQRPDIQIVAEDLGDLRPEVLTLRDHYDMMGMNVATFTLPEANKALEHQLIYTGTHDNQTVKGWYAALDHRTKAKVRKALAEVGYWGEPITRKLVRFVYGSAAAIAIIPLADLLGLDDTARLNTPGTLGSPNWEWRLTDWRALRKQEAFIRTVVKDSGRA